MALFVISDLHLSFSANKPMSVFPGWENHIQRLTANWKRTVKDGDTVVLGGDTSWALKLEDTVEDFRFINSLPGKKLLLKGNHDLWWSTSTKVKNLFSENGFNSIELVYNNCVLAENFAVCGTRGWQPGGEEKIILREAGRLRLSLIQAFDLCVTPIVVMHFPPVLNGAVCRPIVDVLHEYRINKVYCGHLHGAGAKNLLPEFEGIKFKLVSSDQIDFTPLQIFG